MYRTFVLILTVLFFLSTPFFYLIYTYLHDIIRTRVLSNMSTKDKIASKCRKIFARHGYDGLSMRKLADRTGISQSVIYHYFDNKDDLLKYIFNSTNELLGKRRHKLSETKDASDMMKQRIEFQLDNAEEIVAVLKYYLAYRKEFPKFKTGYVPDKTTLHIEEVLERGVASGEFIDMNIEKEAKVITHAINGFLLEFFPKKPEGEEKKELVDSIHTFIMRSVVNHARIKQK